MMLTFYSYKDCLKYAISLGNVKDPNSIKKDLISICGIDPVEFWKHFSKKILSANDYHKICKKLQKYFVKGWPAPYLTNQVYFYGLNFYIKKGVFIPQPDTESLVEKTIELANKFWNKNEIRVLDIGTGCGNIAISLAKIKPEWKVIAIDINEKALELAKKNALTHQIKNISFLRSDLLTSLDPSYYSKINLIVSNPPYIDKAIYKNLLPLTRKQPKNALLASSKGLYFYQKIFQQIQKFNQKKILLLFEIDYQKREELKKLAYDNFPSAFVEFFFDYSKKERVMSIVRNFSE